MGSKYRTAQHNVFLNISHDWHRRFHHDQVFNQVPLLVGAADAGASFSQTALNLRHRANKDWEIAGTNAANAGSTASTGGGLALATAGAANDTIAIKPHTTSALSQLSTVDFSTSDQLGYGARVKTGSSIADLTLCFGYGLTLADVTDFGQGNDNDGVWFRYNPSSNSGKFQCIASRSGTDEVRDSGVTVAADTDYTLEVSVDEDRRAHFFINSGWVASMENPLTAAIDLLPFAGVASSASAAKSFKLRRLVISKEWND